MSDNWIPLCPVIEVPVGGVVRKCADGMERVAVFNLNGVIFVLADTCSHGMASLSEGEIEEGRIICPFHGGSFEIRTGLPVARPCTVAVNSYAVSIRDEVIYARVHERNAVVNVAENGRAQSGCSKPELPAAATDDCARASIDL